MNLVTFLICELICFTTLIAQASNQIQNIVDLESNCPTPLEKSIEEENINNSYTGDFFWDKNKITSQIHIKKNTLG